MRQGMRLVSLMALMAACGHAVAAGPQTEDEFNSQGAASATRALDSVPFLIDHPEILKALKTKILGQRAAMDEATNPAPAAPQQRMITISLTDPGPVNEINTIQGYPTTISFIRPNGRTLAGPLGRKNGRLQQPTTTTAAACAGRHVAKPGKPSERDIYARSNDCLWRLDGSRL